MASADPASASLGPRYAPDDPTLPKPWTGLIDGSTGLQYYWNPDTNVTQYERPSAPVPPKAETPQPTANASAPVPQMQYHQPQPQPQPQTQPQQQPPPQQMHYQPPTQQGYPQPPMPMMPHPAQQMQHQQVQQIQHPQAPYPQVQQIAQPQAQQHQPHQVPIQHGQQGGYHKPEEAVPPYGKQVGYTPGQFQPSAAIPANAAVPAGGSQVQIPQAAVHPMQPQAQMSQPGPMPVSGQQPGGAPVLQMQHGVEAIQRQPQMGSGSRSSNQMGQGTGVNLNLTPVGPPGGLKEHGDDMLGRTRPEFYAHGPNPRETHEMGLQPPKLAALPVAQNLQEMRSGATRTQNFAPAITPGFGTSSARPVTKPFIQAVPAQPFPNAPITGSSPGLIGSADISRSSETEVYMRQHEVTAMGDNVPAPFMTFETSGFPPEILREMHFAGFLRPTPIQAQTWPVAVQGRDIVAIAQTGSGKTLGYLIPAFLHLRRLRNDSQIGPTVLVLSPTRELATQIQDEAMRFGRSSGVSCTCLYGGAPKGPQIREIERGVDIVIATPGRLNDILEINKISFRQLSFLVLDEADRMLDMGFEPQIRRIVNEIPPRRQTLMYTATWPKDVRKIAGDLLYNPVQVNIGSIDELVANEAITQYVEVVPLIDRQRRLEQILRSQERGSKVIIFCSTRRLCDDLTRSIGRGFGATAIHGDKSQGERDWALNQFRSGNKPILVATDVAARGLDVKDIRVVINYDFPTGIEDYVHRIGRTGRAGATGVAYTFLSDQDWKHAADLVKLLEGANQRVPPEVREMAERGAPAYSKGRGGIGRVETGGGRWDSGGGRGIRDNNGFGGSGGRGDHFGGRNDHFGGRGDHFGGRGDHFGGRGDHFGGRGDHFGGRGGYFGGRGSNIGGRGDHFGGRGDHFGGRMGRGRGFGGPGGRGRGGPGPHDRYGHTEGRGRFDNRRPYGDRNRDRSYSRSPERGRSRGGYDRSRSPSRSRSRSRSWTRSRSNSRSRSWSRSRSRSRSRSSSYGRVDRPQGQNYSRPPRVSGFDILPPPVAENPNPPSSVADIPLPSVSNNPSPSVMGIPQQPSGPAVSQLPGSVPPATREMSPMLPGVTDTGGYLKSELIEQVSVADPGASNLPAAIVEPSPGQCSDVGGQEV